MWCITCGALDANNRVASFSSRGPTFDGRIKPNVAALGVKVWFAKAATHINYDSGAGTSYSTPLIAGATALLLSVHKDDWNPAMVLEALTSTASFSSNPNNDVGWGLVDITAAMSYTPPSPIPDCRYKGECDCPKGYYGGYCELQKMSCESFCAFGECVGEVCQCKGGTFQHKECVRPCDERNLCSECIGRIKEAHGCSWCASSESCFFSSDVGECESVLNNKCPDPRQRFSLIITLTIAGLFVGITLLLVLIAVLRKRMAKRSGDVYDNR
eukprot:TRINITY_DN2525_c1_g2_i1.p1 TRINITY_DN2525_c1_g2~~TRINITY_DN2525_c1_g2_i1.p1  ORF type:complete len:271 (+),score=57.62 TRINITY_DN2525_c1_g2_i1:3-815(+)